MKSVFTLMEVGAHYDATGFSCLYKPLAGEPERMTMLYLRDSKGYITGTIFAEAATVKEVML